MEESICQAKSVKLGTIPAKCEQKCLIEEEMKRLIQGINDPIPQNLVCVNYNCRHNIFYKKLFEKHHTYKWKRIQSPLATKLRNCMCLLNGGEGLEELAVGRKIHGAEEKEGEVLPPDDEDGEIKLRAIAETYGISIMGVSHLIQHSLKKIKQKIKKKINEQVN